MSTCGVVRQGVLVLAEGDGRATPRGLQDAAAGAVGDKVADLCGGERGHGVVTAASGVGCLLTFCPSGRL